MRLIIPSYVIILFQIFISYSSYSQTNAVKTDIVKTDSLEAIKREIISVGYGTKLKSRNTEAISIVSNYEINLTFNSSVSQALQGRSAGVSVINSGSAGGFSSVNIRGVTSLFGSSQPLYIVDDMPVSIGLAQSLNPFDIEKIEILKDAASCAIYGSRGGNGVVLITTKKY